MITQIDVRETARRYLQSYPNEQARLTHFLSYLEEDKNIFDRKNASGHVTASGVVLSRDRMKLLLVNHLFLQRYIQPGGHVEPEDSLIRNALREIEEETGISSGALQHIGSEDYPLDIDSHPIPENPKKNEAPHFHFDFRYLFQLSEDVDLVPQEDEVSDLRWFDMNDPIVQNAIGGVCVDKAVKILISSKHGT